MISPAAGLQRFITRFGFFFCFFSIYFFARQRSVVGWGGSRRAKLRLRLISVIFVRLNKSIDSGLDVDIACVCYVMVIRLYTVGFRADGLSLVVSVCWFDEV